MKNCPYCAEEIQDAAKVCKHCGRDLVSTATAQKVEIVQPKARTGCFTWVVAIFAGLILFSFIIALITPSTPTSSTSTSTPRQARPVNTSGTYGESAAVLVEERGIQLVSFSPALPDDDISIHAALLYVLVHFYGAEMSSIEPRGAVNEKFLRYGTNRGTFDLLIIRSEEGLSGVSITTR